MNYKRSMYSASMNFHNQNPSTQTINPLYPNFPMNYNPNMPIGMINPMMTATGQAPQMGLPSQMPMMMNMPFPLPQQAKPSYTESKKVWVGKIPENVSDTFMLKLLEACGTVAFWKRVADSKGKLNSFGICEYLTVESMLKSLRLLNNFAIEDSELQIKVGAETEEFLKKWREKKKEEWIDSLRQKGFQVDLNEIRKKENNGEPLDWELQLISKDHETQKLLYEIMAQRTEIETYARQSERPEQYLKDLKELAQGSLSQHFESERERERMKIQAEKIKKLDKMFRDEEKKWEKHEEERDREKSRRRYEKEYIIHQKNKLIDKDLNYDSESEKKKISQNPKKYEEHQQMRLKEKEYDDMIRRKENGDYPNNNNDDTIRRNKSHQITDIATLPKEPEAKTQIEIEEYKIEEDDTITNNKSPDALLQLNINTTKISAIHKNNDTHLLDEDDNDDPYTSKPKISHIDINPETERELLEMSKEVKLHITSDEDDTQIKENKAKTIQILKKVPPERLREIQKSIIELIPKDKDEILKYDINWGIVEDYQLKKNKLKPWLEKKLKEYFDVDQSFINLLLDKIGKSNPYEILDTLKTILENDAEEFMCKLWNNLIFESIKIEKILKYQNENTVEEKDNAK